MADVVHVRCRDWHTEPAPPRHGGGYGRDEWGGEDGWSGWNVWNGEGAGNGGCGGNGNGFVKVHAVDTQRSDGQQLQSVCFRRCTR